MLVDTAPSVLSRYCHEWKIPGEDPDTIRHVIGLAGYRFVRFVHELGIPLEPTLLTDVTNCIDLGRSVFPSEGEKPVQLDQATESLRMLRLMSEASDSRVCRRLMIDFFGKIPYKSKRVRGEESDEPGSTLISLLVSVARCVLPSLICLLIMISRIRERSVFLQVCDVCEEGLNLISCIIGSRIGIEYVDLVEYLVSGREYFDYYMRIFIDKLRLFREIKRGFDGKMGKNQMQTATCFGRIRRLAYRVQEAGPASWSDGELRIWDELADTIYPRFLSEFSEHLVPSMTSRQLESIVSEVFPDAFGLLREYSYLYEYDPSTFDLKLSQLGAVTTQEGAKSENTQEIVDISSVYRTILRIECSVQSLVLDRVSSLLVFPNEESLWGLPLAIFGKTARAETNAKQPPLPLPRITLEYLSLRDFLIRNLELYFHEIVYAIRLDLEYYALNVVDPRTLMPSDLGTDDALVPNASAVSTQIMYNNFTDHVARVNSCAISSVPSNLDVEDAWITAQITLDFSNCSPHVRQEFLRDLLPGQIIYMLTVGGRSVTDRNEKRDWSIEVDDMISEYRIHAVRACKVVSVPYTHSEQLSIRCAFDGAQFKRDAVDVVAGKTFEGLYNSFNLCVRRDPESNNYHGLMSSLKSLAMDSQLDEYLPSSIADVLLGYGNLKKENVLPAVFESVDVSDGPGFKFTPRQQEAIRSALREGFSLIVGPPGTGKSDVAVKIVSLLDKHLPNERVLLIARSNQALNNFFTKIVSGGIDERKLLRLGIGEGQLKLTHDEGDRKEFSAAGRIDFMVHHLGSLTNEAGRLAVSMGLSKDLVQTCDSCSKFREHYFRRRMSIYQQTVEKLKEEIAGQESAPGEDKAMILLKRAIEHINTYPWLGVKARRLVDFCHQKSKPPEPKVKKHKCDVMDEAEVEDEPPENESEHESEDEILLDDKENFIDLERLRDGKMSMLELMCPILDFLPYDVFSDDAEVTQTRLQAEIVSIEELFDKISDCQPFEAARGTHGKVNWMVTQFARIVAMTSTRAALSRKELLDSHFQYDTVVIEEAAQLLDVETVLSCMLQNPRKEGGLKRIVLLGDHLQLGPIVQHRELAKRTNFGLSLFSRLVRLHPERAIWLDAQGRSRPELSGVWKLRYDSHVALGDLNQDQFAKPNPGFKYVAQFIDCYNGVEGHLYGVSHWRINQIEARWAVALYAYMVLKLGYSPEKIALLTSYSAQRRLIRSELRKMQRQYTQLKHPLDICSIDEYQGQQADYVIVSLVRAVQFGFLADQSRITVALSRARLGLWVIGSRTLFERAGAEQSLIQNLVASTKGDCTLKLLADDGSEIAVSNLEGLWERVV